MAHGSSPLASPYHPLQIGTSTIPGNVFLAPLAGYTDRAFREICREFGAPFCYTEMVSAEAVARGNRKTIELMDRGDDEELLGIQIFLSSPGQAERALPELLRHRPTLIDINCGCPVPKVVKTGAGAALMRSPETIHRIVSVLASQTDTPVTVKIRSGWDSDSITYLEAAGAAEEAGAAAVGLHARTRAQGYSGSANWEHIAELAARVRVPVLGSGDLFTAHDIHRMLTQTGCDGVMCARGAIGNPFIFRDVGRLLEGAEGEGPGGAEPEERLSAAVRHFEKALRYRGEHYAVREMKKHFAAYTKGLPGGSALRNRLMRCTDGECYERVLGEYLAAPGPFHSRHGRSPS